MLLRDMPPLGVACARNDCTHGAGITIGPSVGRNCATRQGFDAPRTEPDGYLVQHWNRSGTGSWHTAAARNDAYCARRQEPATRQATQCDSWPRTWNSIILRVHTPGSVIQSKHQPDPTWPSYISAMEHAFAPSSSAAWRPMMPAMIPRRRTCEIGSPHQPATERSNVLPRHVYARAVRLALPYHNDCAAPCRHVPRARKQQPAAVIHHCTLMP